MLSKYTEYIKEGSSSHDNVVYWYYELKELIEKNWTEISSKKAIPPKLYNLKFKAGDGQYDYYSVLIEDKGGSEYFYVENLENSKFIEVFQEKFKSSFFTNPDIYYKNLKYVPKFLGDVSHFGVIDKYNL